MIKHFTHKFQNGKTINLQVDLSKNPPEMISSYKFTEEDYGGAFEDEYKIWVNEIVFSEVYNNLNDEQLKYFEEKGKLNN